MVSFLFAFTIFVTIFVIVGGGNIAEERHKKKYTTFRHIHNLLAIVS